MTGGTWRHLAGTPLDSVPDAQDTIEELVDEYADIEAEPAQPDGGATTRTASEDPLGSTTTEKNPYFDLNLKRVADTGPFARCRTASENLAAGEWQGPHPAHGATSDQPDVESTNFRIEGGQWVCYAHGTGGGVLQLIAALESQINIDCNDCGNKRNAGEIYQDLQKFLKTCLVARDEYAAGALDGEEPSYRALVAVAEMADLGFKDKEEQILGSASYNVAKRIYDDLALDDV